MDYRVWAGIGLAALALVAVVVWHRRRGGGSVVGPLFWYELVVLARRGVQPRLRVLLVGLLLVGLFFTYLYTYQGRELEALAGGAQLDQARFANTFLNIFLIVQLLAVVLITPAMVGGAITEEKERGTLDFLRTSLLTNREIVLGKFAARLALVVGVLLAGLPVLALTSLFGGVDLGVLLAGYTIAAGAALSLGAYSLYVGVVRDTLREVLLRVYTLVAWATTIGACCSCLPGGAALSPPSALGWLLLSDSAMSSNVAFWRLLAFYAAIHGVATAVFTALAVVRIRPLLVRDEEAKREPLPRHPDPDVAVRFADPGSTTRPFRLFTVPPVGDSDPLLWKERYFAGRNFWSEHESLSIAGLSGASFLLGMVLFLSVVQQVNSGRWIGEAVNPVSRITLTGGAILLGLLVGARSAAAVARERQRQTLDGLLSLPLDRANVLKAKWLAALRWAGRAVGAAVVVVIGSLIVGAVHPVGLLCAAVQFAGWLAFTNSLGLWLSVACRSVTRATVYLIAWGLVLWVAPLILMPLAVALVGPEGEGVAGLSLPIGMWQSLFGWREMAEELADREAYVWRATQVAAALAGFANVAAAWVLWRRAVARFEREGR